MKGDALLAAVARVLTLSRFVAIPPFVWLVLEERAAAAVIYLWVIASDAADGWLARRARSATVGWGRVDVVADVTFNAAALGAAAWRGVFGPWVPASVLVLGARFLWRTRRGTGASLPEDTAGKLAGVVFYALAGAVALEAAGLVPVGPAILGRLGDVVCAYAAFVLVSGRARGSPRATRRSLVAGSR